MPTLGFEIHMARGPQPYFVRVVDSDGTKLATSETYRTKASAKHGAEVLKLRSHTASVVYEHFLARNGKWDWHAQSRNGEIVIESTKWFDSAYAAERAAKYVEANAYNAVIRDCAPY